MALFGEKYGDVVRMVEIGEGEYSRELCGGTHVRTTAEIGLFRILSETSSSANVRRIEAVTGPAAVELLREHDALLEEVASTAAHAPRGCPGGGRARSCEERRQLEKRLKEGAGRRRGGGVDVDALAARRAGDRRGDGARRARRGRRRQGAARARRPPEGQARRRRDPARRGRRRARPPRRERRARSSSSAASRPARSSRLAAEVVGGGGGGRDTMAQAGGRDPEKLDEAIAAGRAAIEAALAADRARRCRRARPPDRCGCSRSTTAARAAAARSATRRGTIVTPIEPVERPARRRGLLAASRRSSREREVERVVVGLPLSLDGGDTEQTRETRDVRRAPRGCARRCGSRSSCTTSASRRGSRSAWRAVHARSEDSRAAAHLLEGWLALADRVRVRALGPRRSITAGTRTNHRGARARPPGARTRAAPNAVQHVPPPAEPQPARRQRRSPIASEPACARCPPAPLRAGRPWSRVPPGAGARPEQAPEPAPEPAARGGAEPEPLDRRLRPPPEPVAPEPPPRAPEPRAGAGAAPPPAPASAEQLERARSRSTPSRPIAGAAGGSVGRRPPAAGPCARDPAGRAARDAARCAADPRTAASSPSPPKPPREGWRHRTAAAAACERARPREARAGGAQPRRGRSPLARLGAVAALVAVVAAVLLLLSLADCARAPRPPPAPAVVKVLIPEGKTRAADRRDRHGGGAAGQLPAWRRGSSPLLNPAHYGAPHGHPDLEGFLFPATYD